MHLAVDNEMASTPTGGDGAGGGGAPPITLPSDATEKRRPGRKPGMPKVEGSGRKRGGQNWTSTEIRNALVNQSHAIETVAAIAAGQPMKSTGPTGKQIMAYPSIGERLRAVELVLRKVLPDLAASEITLDATTRSDDFDIDALMKAVAEAYESRNGRVAHGIPDAAHDFAPHVDLASPAANGHMANNLAGIPGIASDDEEGDAAPAIATTEKFSNGAVVTPWILDGSNERRLAVFDRFGQLHGYRRDLARAVELARSLPGPNGDLDA